MYFIASLDADVFRERRWLPWPEKPRSLMSHCRMFSLSSIFCSSPRREALP